MLASSLLDGSITQGPDRRVEGLDADYNTHLSLLRSQQSKTFAFILIIFFSTTFGSDVHVVTTILRGKIRRTGF